MKADSLRHQFRNVQEAMKDARARKDNEAIRLLNPVVEAGEAMLAHQVGDTIDTNWIEVFRDRMQEAADKRPDLDQWFERTPDWYLTSHP